MNTYLTIQMSKSYWSYLSFTQCLNHLLVSKWYYMYKHFCHEPFDRIKWTAAFCLFSFLQSYFFLLRNNLCIFNNFQHKYAIYFYLHISLLESTFTVHFQADFTAKCQKKQNKNISLVYTPTVLLYSFFKYSMIKKRCFTIQWKIVCKLHKFSMSPSTLQQDVGINISFHTSLYYNKSHG